MPTQTLQHRVEAALEDCGSPLRWAITAASGDRPSVTVEAVVVCSED